MDNKPLPAGLVRPVSGELYWILDNESAQFLPDSYLQLRENMSV